MHLMATYLPVLMDWALRTSENVPSPFLLIKRYSNPRDKYRQVYRGEEEVSLTVHILRIIKIN
jgi:hypothetical protein